MVAVDALMAGNAGDSTLPLKWEQHHFIKAQGSKTYVPFTLTIDPPAFTASTTVGIYIRVAKHGEPRARAGAARRPEEGARPPRPRLGAAAVSVRLRLLHGCRAGRARTAAADSAARSTSSPATTTSTSPCARKAKDASTPAASLKTGDL